MIEAVLAWIGLLVSITTEDALWFLGSGVFAVATQISRVVDQMEMSHDR